MPATSAKGLLRLLVTGLCLAWAADGAAAEVHVVVLARPGTPLAARLRAELLHLGFVVDEHDEGDPMQRVRELPRDQRADAVLRIETVGPSIELWLPSPSNDGSMASEVVTIASIEGAHDDIVVRAIEVLRARLLERGITVLPRATRAAPPPPSAAAPRALSPTPAVATEASPNLGETRPAKLWLGVGGSGVLSPGAPFTGAVTLELGASVLPILRLALSGSLPVAVRTVANLEGSSKIGETLLGASLMLQRPPRAWPVEPYAGAGVAALWVRAEGSAQDPYAGHSVQLFAWCPFVRGGARLLLSRWLALQLDFLAGWAEPHLEVTVVDRQIATVGKPLLAGTLALAIGWAP
jgi:hypothetical protein